MTDFFNKYLFDIVSFFYEFSESLICLTLLALSYKRRERFALRYSLTVILGLCLSLLMAMWKAPFNEDVTSPISLFVRITSYTLLSLYMLGMLLFCWKEHFCESLICWCITVAVKTFTGKSFSLILNVVGVNGLTISFFNNPVPLWYDYLLQAVYHIGFFVFFAVLNKRRARSQYNKQAFLDVAIISFFVVLVTYVLTSFARVYESESYAMTVIVRLFTLLCSLFILSLVFILLERNRMRSDLEVTEQLLLQEQKRYGSVKDSVEAINMKMHDLKHHLNDLERKLNEEEIASIREALAVYDSNIKTGNEILDVVLYEKLLYCQRGGVRLTCMADGSLLSFLSPSHLYALFSNAIDNAVEAASTLSDPEARIIGISVRTESKGILIEIYNFFDNEIRMEKSLPVSTKVDSSHHGYGMKSIQYIVSLYDGTMSISVEDGIFTLRLLFPVPDL